MMTGRRVASHDENGAKIGGSGSSFQGITYYRCYLNTIC